MKDVEKRWIMQRNEGCREKIKVPEKKYRM